MRLLVFVSVLFHSAAAWACGGFFCSTQPVDQNAERILFRVHDDDTITAVVEISYTGVAEEFSWVVPVPDTPALGTVPEQTLRFLDQATAVQIIPPPIEDCLSLAIASDDGELSARSGGVFVEELPRVGPFDPVVLDSDDPVALIAWLNDNGYLITPEMEPYVEAYLGAGMKFLGLKLATDAETADIEPIVMNYPASEPMVPIVLTSVAAEPEMGVLVFIAASSRYEPTNYASVTVEPSFVRFNPFNGRNNYFSLVSFLVDEAGGRGFVTEYAGTSADTSALVAQQFVPDEVQETLNEVFREHAYITRMYTRISGWEMLADPMFAPTDKGDVSNVIDLSNREQIDACADEDAIPLPCGDTYCGPGASCATTDSGEGCVCPVGSVARTITSPQPFRIAVFCQPENFDLLQSVAGMEQGVCAGNPCGENGACVSTGGFASCSCNDGFAAVASVNGQPPRCVRANQLYSAAQLFQADNDTGCGCQGSRGGGFLWIAALLLFRLWRAQSSGGRRTCQRA